LRSMVFSVQWGLRSCGLRRAAPSRAAMCAQRAHAPRRSPHDL